MIDQSTNTEVKISTSDYFGNCVNNQANQSVVSIFRKEGDRQHQDKQLFHNVIVL